MDKKIQEIISGELKRQRSQIELIASENYVSEEILAVVGSVLTNKYAEGYPHARYYGGCEWVDKAEELAIERAKQLFNCQYANVQPHSGSSANLSVYAAILNPGDKVLALSLSAGGHLTHGHKVSFSGMTYEFHHYGVSHANETIDMNEVALLARKVRPRLIVTGASNYSRVIDFARFREIADEVGSLLMVDMAHIAGLVATGAHPSPFPHAHIVTSTTHKTLAGPRGAFILSNDAQLAKKIDKAVFPGTQGGPLMHVIAAKAVAFGDALQPAYKSYIDAVVAGAKAFSEYFVSKKRSVVAGGTDNHLFTLDVKRSYNMTGLEAEQLLAKVGITVNKNSIPFDPLPPSVSSGIRIGTPAMTTRGFSPREFVAVAEIIDSVLSDASTENLSKNAALVQKILKRFEIYPDLT